MTRVLLVDDKEENLLYLRTLLEAHGYSIDSARNGAEALERAAESPPSMVVSDLLMPVMDGYSLLKRWKGDAHLSKVPFVVYTATYSDPEDEQLALRMGADAFILKPAEPEDFMARVRAVEAATSTTSPATPRAPTDDEAVLLQEYNEALIRKLEARSLQLEDINRVLVKDIAARKTAEAALRESEARFRQLAENIDDVFWLNDLEGRIIYVSPAYERTWGRSRETLLMQPESWIEAVHVDDRDRIRDSLTRYPHGAWDETFRIVRPDGTTRWLRARAYAVRRDDGQVDRIAGVSRDITEYRVLEQQFLHAQKMEAVGRLAGGIAHDFNNLLSIVLSYAHLVLNALPAEDPNRADVEEIKRAGERATNLTRQLLSFSRQQMVQPQVFDLGEVVSDMERMLTRVLGDDIELQLETAAGGARVLADPGQIEQVVLNLAINARDAMPDGGRLSISVRPVRNGPDTTASHPGVEYGHHVLLQVTDTGLGMEEAARAHIFEPFFTTKDKGKGTGLGLSTVFGIVKQCRGTIVVDSEWGRGSTFKVYLPMTTESAAAAVTDATPIASLGGKETILLVEDDDQLRELNTAVLARNGYQVIDARNGNEALLVAEHFAKDIDLLISDVVMPRMNGRELAKRIAASRPNMRVLFVSGYSVESLWPNDAPSPRLAFLQKPFTPSGFLRAVREVLDRSEASG